MRADALLVGVDPFFFQSAGQLVAAAARQRIPTLYFRREFADVGGLITYGTNFPELFRVVGVYAGRILKGEKARRFAGPAADQIRIGHQSQDRQGARPRRAAALLARADEVIE